MLVTAGLAGLMAVGSAGAAPPDEAKYRADLARVVAKYGDAAAVPEGSVNFLARFYRTSIAGIRADLEGVGEVPPPVPAVEDEEAAPDDGDPLPTVAETDPAPVPAAAPAQAAKAAPRQSSRTRQPGRSTVSVEIEGGGIDDKGTQGKVREYDRRKYSAGDLRKLRVDHQGQDGNFWVDLRHPLTRSWEDADIGYRSQDVSFRYAMRSLTHNDATNFQNMEFDGVMGVMVPATLANFSVAGEGTWEPNMNRVDENPGFDFYLDRREQDLAFALGSLTRRRLRLGFWKETESGYPELKRPNPANLPGFSTVEHPQRRFKHPVDRVAKEFEFGGDGLFGRDRDAAGYATYFHTVLADDTPDIASLMRGGNAADLRPVTRAFPEKSSDGFRAGFSVPLGDRGRMRLDHVTRDRTSGWNGYNLDTNTFTASVDYRAEGGWGFFSSYRDFSRRTGRNFGYVPVDAIPSNAAGSNNVIENPAQGIYDEDSEEFEIGFRYLGWEDHQVSVGYRSEDWKQPNAFRTANSLALHNALVALGVDDRLLSVNEEGDRDGFWVKFSGAPTRRLAYRAAYEQYDADRDYFTRGQGQETEDLTASLSYDFRDDLTGYLEYSDRSRKGQIEPYQEEARSFTVGGFGMAGRWGVGLAYTREEFDNDYLANWQQPSGAGVRPFVTMMDFYTSENDVYSLTLTPPKIRNRVQLGFDLTHTDSRGILPSDYYDTAFTTGGAIFIAGTKYGEINKVDVDIDRIAFRADFDVGPKDGSDQKVGLEYTFGHWNDSVDRVGNGNFGAAWITYKRKL